MTLPLEIESNLPASYKLTLELEGPADLLVAATPPGEGWRAANHPESPDVLEQIAGLVRLIASLLSGPAVAASDGFGQSSRHTPYWH